VAYRCHAACPDPQPVQNIAGLGLAQAGLAGGGKPAGIPVLPLPGEAGQGIGITAIPPVGPNAPPVQAQNILPPQGALPATPPPQVIAQQPSQIGGRQFEKDIKQGTNVRVRGSASGTVRRSRSAVVGIAGITWLVYTCCV